MKTATSLIAIVLCAACGGAPDATSDGVAVGSSQQALSNKDFDVDFANCAEFVGIGLVPGENAQPFVPPGYTLANVGTQAMVVVRVSKCASAVIDGKVVSDIITSQIGITLQGPDNTADLNNYTVAYATNEARLHARLQAAGLTADNSNGLSLSLASGSLVATATSPQSSSFQVTGSAAVPPGPPTTFVASWWANGVHGAARARTVFPAINFNFGATTTLTTAPGTTLATLIGGTTLSFPILDSYNTFAASHLEVRDTN
jgi:hypothetical protein